MGAAQRLDWGRKRADVEDKVRGQMRAILEPRRKILRALDIGWGLWELQGEDRCERYLYGIIRLV